MISVRRKGLLAVWSAASMLVAAAATAAAADDPAAQAVGYVVTNLDDSGAGSLRQAVIDANANPGLDEITFATGLSGEISLASGSVGITDSATISGPGPLTLSVAGNSTGSVLFVTSAAEVVISGLTIKGGGGMSTNSGGVYVNNGAADVTIRNSIITGNTGFYGGGVSVYSGQLLIQESRITGNTATGSGGGVATASSTTLERVEISGNTSAISGGGLFLNSGTLVVNSSTISGNTAPVSGGVHRFTGGALLTVNGSTIVDNHATSGPAGGFDGAGTVSLQHSIVSGNTPSDVASQMDAAWSLIADTSGATVNDLGGNQLGVDPQLEGLEHNGGLTRTHFPTPSSPVIDAGDPALASPPAVDQRGARRVARSTSAGSERIDIGAVEVVPMDDEWQTDEDTALTIADPGVLSSDNRGYTASVVAQPAHGQVVLEAGGGFTYSPSKDYHGIDSFTYGLVGPDAPGYLSTVTIDVLSVYDPFLLTDDSYELVNDGSSVSIDVLANDSGDDLTIVSVTQGQLGAVATDGSVVIYTPDQGAFGTDTFGYVATDGTTQATATVTATISATTTFTATTAAARILDTRPGGITVDGLGAAGGIVQAGSTLVLDVAGRGNVPDDASAAVLNLTGTGGTGPGFVTVWPCDTTQPLASSLNFDVGTTIPNEIVTALSHDGTVCLATAVNDVHLIADAFGYSPIGSGYVGLNPGRLLDTRPDATTLDGIAAGGGIVSADTTLELQVAGRGDVVEDAGAAVLNLTATGGTGPGFVTAWPCDQTRPLASSLNFDTGTTTPNELVAPLSSTGTVCLFVASSDVHLIADATGYLPAGNGYSGLNPTRLLDTRTEGSTIDGVGAAGGAVEAGSTLELVVAGRGGIPDGASAAVINLTATAGTGPGFVTAWPCGQTRPLASTLNFDTGTTLPNEVIAALSPTGKVCLYVANSDVHLIADATGSIG